jgi:hypothetical protein
MLFFIILNYYLLFFFNVNVCLFILASVLPSIAYLTLIDKYMISSLLYVGSMAVIVVILDYLEITDQADEPLAYIFVGMFGFQIVAMLLFVVICYFARKIELKKLIMTRHQVEIAEYERLNGVVDSKDEFLVHSYFNEKITSKLPDSSIHSTYAGVLRNEIQPPEAAGWLFDENDWIGDDTKVGNLKPRIVKQINETKKEPKKDPNRKALQESQKNPITTIGLA